LVDSDSEVSFLHCFCLAFAMQSNGRGLYNGFVKLMPCMCPALRYLSGFLLRSALAINLWKIAEKCTCNLQCNALL